MGRSAFDGVSDGEWAVFAERVVAERDELRAKLAECERERDEMRSALVLAGKAVLANDRERALDYLTRRSAREAVLSSMEMAEARADRLEAAIREAPHDFDCASVSYKVDAEGIFLSPVRGVPCDCWKRDALGGK